jgi:hypothetical protein
VVNYFRPEEQPLDSALATAYRRTVLRESTSGDVYAMMSGSEFEIVSRSKSVIASHGEKKKGYSQWLNMAAFEEDSMVVNRKYFFAIDERPKSLSVNPQRSMLFDSEMILNADVLSASYANNSEKQIAVLKYVIDQVLGDIKEVSEDNSKIGVCGMLINQTLETILRDLEKSPAIAVKLDRADGLEFDHITLGKGFAKINIFGDKAVIAIRTGKLVGRFDEVPVEKKKEPSPVKQ